jgi:hypothetical protein
MIYGLYYPILRLSKALPEREDKSLRQGLSAFYQEPVVKRATSDGGEEMGNNSGVPCIGLNNCQRAKRNSVGAFMCMSLSGNRCLRKEGPVPK